MAERKYRQRQWNYPLNRRSRSHDDKRSSREQQRSSSDDRSRRRPNDDQSRRPSRSTRKQPLFNPFSRGRKPTRDRRPFSLERNRYSSRSTSRSTSGETSRDGLDQNFHWKAPHWDIDTSKGFTIPPVTPIPSSRLDVHLYLALSCLVGMASLSSAVPPSFRSGSEVASLTIQGLSFTISLITGIGLRYSSSRVSLTFPLFQSNTLLSHLSIETLLNILQLILWCICTGLNFATSNVTNDTPASIWNANLFYSTLSGLALTAYLVADGCAADESRVFWEKGHNFKPVALQRIWALLLIANVTLVAFCLQGLAACSENCTEFTMGIVLGIIATLLAIGHFARKIFLRMLRPRLNRVSLVEIVLASFIFVLSLVNAALLSSKEEYASVNVYFTCWTSFFLSLNLCLQYIDAHFSPGSMMDDAEYESWAKINEPKRPVSDRRPRRLSTGSTKSSNSSSFVALIQDAAQAEAHLEQMCASHESSEPILYLDNKTDASPLSIDQEFGSNYPTRRRSDPSVSGFNTGIDPTPSVSTVSQQKSVRALMPPPPMNSRRPSPGPQESIRTQIPLSQPRYVPPPTRQGRRPSVDPEGSLSTVSEYKIGPMKRRASVARGEMAESVSTSSLFEQEKHQPMKMGRRYESVKSMTPFITKTVRPSVDGAPVPRPKLIATKNSSMFSLFEEGATKNTMASMAQVKDQLASDESSPITIDPISSNVRSQSLFIETSPSMKTNKSKRSRANSVQSPGKSLISSRKGSTAPQSRGPSTISEDGSRSSMNLHGSGPLTVSSNDQSVQDRPVRDISMDNVSIVSEPTMDGFDQSQRYDKTQFRRLSTTGTVEGDDHISQQGAVDQMVMLALKQAHESRQQSLRKLNPDESDVPIKVKSPMQYVPRQASGDEAETRPQSSTKRILKTTTGNGSAGKSIHSFYSNNTGSSRDDSAFAC